MNRRFGRIRITALMLILAIGCSEEPRQRLANAKLALDSASAAGAGIYCEAGYARARSLFDSAVTLIAFQRRKPALFRSYTRAEELLYESLRLTRELIDSLPAARENYRRIVSTQVEQARQTVEATRLAAVAALKEGKKAGGISGEVKDMEEMVAAAAAALAAGDLVRAHMLATSVIDKAANYRALIEQLPRPAARFSGGTAKNPAGIARQ